MATYYIDATNGLDTNDGLSEVNAWQTLAKVRSVTYLAGDNILFKSGEVFEGYLEYSASSGTLGNPITFGSYGDGVNPIITNIETHSLTWSIDGTLWSASIPTTLSRLLRDNTEILRANYNTLGMTVGDYTYELLNQPLGLVDAFEWVYANNTVWINSDPTGHTFQYSTRVRTMYFIGVDYISIENLNIQGGYTASAGFYNSTGSTMTNCRSGKYGTSALQILSSSADISQDITISDCNFDAFFEFDIEVDMLMYKGYSSRGAGDGLIITDKATNCEISNCVFKNWLHLSLGLYGYATGDEVSTIHIHHNNFTSPQASYGGGVGVIGNVHGCEINNNLWVNTSVTNQLVGWDNHYHHNVLDTLHNSTIKGDNDIANALATNGATPNYNYPLDVAPDNIFEYNTVINGDTYGLVFFSDGLNLNGAVNGLDANHNLIWNCGLSNSSTDSYGMNSIFNENNDAYYETYSVTDNVFWNDASVDGKILRHNSLTDITVAEFNATTTVDKVITNNISVQPDVNDDYTLPTGSLVEGYGAMPDPSVTYYVGVIPTIYDNGIIGKVEFNNSFSYANLHQYQLDVDTLVFG